MGKPIYMSDRRITNFLTTLGCGVFFSLLIFVNYELSGHHHHEDSLEKSARLAPVHPILDDHHPAPSQRRQRRDVTDLTAEKYPITLGVPYDGCEDIHISSSEFPRAACFGLCHNGATSCYGSVKDVFRGNADLVCMAKYILLGFTNVPATHYITNWIRQHPKILHKYGTMFTMMNGDTKEPDFYRCPDVQLSDSTTEFYMKPYNMSLMYQADQTSYYYFHCEDCLSAYYADLQYGTFFLDLPTALFSYIQAPSQKFIIAIQNPTDRLFSEYFYSFIKAGYTDLTDVGGQNLHQLVVDAISDVEKCIVQHGPTPCVFGVETGIRMTSTKEMRQLMYRGLYSVVLKQVIQQISVNQIIFVKSEELSADPTGVMSDLNAQLGLSYTGVAPDKHPIHKPILEDTIQILDEFYTPFNADLAAVLGDDKWSYVRSGKKK